MRSCPQLCIHGTIEAAELYKEAFDATFGLTVKHDDGTYAHLSLMHGDTELFSMTERSRIEEPEHLKSMNLRCCAKQDDNDNAPACPVVTVGMYGLGTKEAVLKAYNVLKREAKAFDPNGPKSLPWLELDFILVDKFGVCWEVGT